MILSKLNFLTFCEIINLKKLLSYSRLINYSLQIFEYEIFLINLILRYIMNYIIVNPILIFFSKISKKDKENLERSKYIYYIQTNNICIN